MTTFRVMYTTVQTHSYQGNIQQNWFISSESYNSHLALEWNKVIYFNLSEWQSRCECFAIEKQRKKQENKLHKHLEILRF